MRRDLAAPHRVLVVRNDKLGDFTLALPTFALLKQALPNTHIAALVPNYTREIAELCPWIDSVVIDPGKGQERALRRALRTEDFDAAITLFSTTRIGAALFARGIRYRLAPATKIAQIFYNHRLLQRRSRSEKPEFEYNLDLAREFLRQMNVTPAPDLPRRPFLALDAEAVAQREREFRQRHSIEDNQRLVFVHPGSGGSANNLSLEQYATLARELVSDNGHTIVISSGPGEVELGERLGQALQGVAHVHYRSQEGLTRFVETLAFCDLFISGSTGPLHLAGALDRPTAGFYPRRRSSTPLRWQTLNTAARRLAFAPPADAEESDMSRIDVTEAAAAINQHFLQGD